MHVATDPKATLELRRSMKAENAQYVYPKGKAVEVASDQEAPLVPSKVVIEIVPTPTREAVDAKNPSA